VALIVPRSIADRVRDNFMAFVAHRDYPCLGARSALRRGGIRVVVYGAMGTEDTTAALAADLGAFALETPTSSRFVAFAAVFVEPAPVSEAEFEARLWHQLTRLAGADDSPSPADGVNDDPEDPHFAFSFARTAFFVIGLHAESSRLARRFGWPALVFNPHAQFRRLRAEQRFEGLRRAIRARDVALQGDINPNLADMGERSEARQYSGRATDNAWRCPFHRKRE
jgi:FPC/CPF motif-containing protein YcgG